MLASFPAGKIYCQANGHPLGKRFSDVKNMDLPMLMSVIRYFAGWADKNHGQTIEVFILSKAA